jgi:hypothetical protein
MAAIPFVIPQADTDEGGNEGQFAILMTAAGVFAAGAASAATTDDVKWIKQCVADNKGGAADDVVLKYCTCMNNKMSDTETQWEKTHATERKACDAEAGWK